VNKDNKNIPHCWIDLTVRLDETLVNDKANFLSKEKKNIEFKQFIAIGLATIQKSQISQTCDYKRKRCLSSKFLMLLSLKFNFLYFTFFIKITFFKILTLFMHFMIIKYSVANLYIFRNVVI